jgi:hypothetical protein
MVKVVPAPPAILSGAKLVHKSHLMIRSTEYQQITREKERWTYSGLSRVQKESMIVLTIPHAPEMNVNQ